MVFSKLFLEKAIAVRPCNCELSQNRSCPKLPAAHQFSHRASRKVRRPCFEASETRLSETTTENFFDRLPKIKLQTFSSITQSKAVEDSGNKVILKADLFDCSDKTFEKVLQYSLGPFHRL